MRVLVTWGSKFGGTEGIARIISETLTQEGHSVTTVPASTVRDVENFDAVIVGGGLYANRWHRDARRFVARHVRGLRQIPVWLFSSGPLDDSADREAIAPPTQVAVLAERIGAIGHATFGGRIAADSKGWMAQQMAKQLTGDWRNPERIRAWAIEVARALPEAKPRAMVEPAGRAAVRVPAHALVGWAVSALVLIGLLAVLRTGLAFTLHAIVAPLVFVAVAVHYFRKRGAREPLPVAMLVTAIAGVLHALVTAPLARTELVTSFTGMWLPLALIFVATWLTGLFVSSMPWPKRAPKPPRARDVPALNAR